MEGIPVRRVAVLRCNALGDYLMATPALAALHARFLSGRPGPVDRVRVLPRVDGLAGQPRDAPDPAALPAFLRAERYDLAVQLHGGGRASNPLVAALGAR